MTIDERDYMRRRTPDFTPRKPWWKRLPKLPSIATATAILGLGSAAIWFLHDARSLLPDTAPAEGSLRVNINTATLTELESIPGIGDSLAKLIVARRPYTSADQLIEVSGIGPISLESLRPYVKVEGETEKLR